MDRILTGRLFQSEGALNINAFLAIDLETAGTETKSCMECDSVIDNLGRSVPYIVLNGDGN